jgi:hypothetical protein
VIIPRCEALLRGDAEQSAQLPEGAALAVG